LGNGFSALPQQKIILLSGLPARAAKLVQKMHRAGLRVVLRDFTCTAGIATIDCTLIDESRPSGPKRFGGVGTHPDARVAICRALTEAAQSRVTFIQGGREDIQHILDQLPGDSISESPGSPHWEETATSVAFEGIPSVENERIDEDVALILDKLPSYGLKRVIAFDLTRPEVGIPVVKIVVPEAETWSVFHLHTGRGALGPRALSVI
jgi:ribosomal protein S12 methylthiotransferase accessory factor